MDKQKTDFLFEQIKNIVLNKSLAPNEHVDDEDFTKIMQALSYLSECLSESNNFLNEIAAGNLAAPPPNRKNFLAGSIKELHAGLKHLSWQANQVAQGDYNQSVNFLGEFSDSFNEMTAQLKEREEKLIQQSEALEQSNKLMQSIMDGINESIIVVSQKESEIVYINKSAKTLLSQTHLDECVCDGECDLLNNYVRQNFDNREKHMVREFHCPTSKKVFQIDTFALQWNGDLAYASRIVDVSEEFKEKLHIEDMAYKDELTSLYNRRYCMTNVEKLLIENQAFTFCMIDADKLKFANDNFGHEAGDEYLKTIAKEISSVSRSTDIVCRLGGDEYAVVFIGNILESAKEKMENINKRLAENKRDYPMSISYGIQVVEDSKDLTLKKVISEADRLMYKHKREKNSS